MKSDTDNQSPLSIYSSKSDEDKLSLVKDIITSTKDNRELLERIVDECMCHLYGTTGIDPKTVKSGYGGYKNEIEKWIIARFANNPALTPSRVVSECRKIFDIRSKNTRFLLNLARKVKNRIRMRVKRGSLIIEKANMAQPEIKAVRQTLALAERAACYANPNKFKLSQIRDDPSYVDKMIGTSSLNPEAGKYWNRHIAVFRKEMIMMGLYNVAYALFDALALYGKCPSVLNNRKYDREASDYMLVKDALQQVNLIAHTFRVLDIGLKLLKSEPILWSTSTAVIMIIMVLASDISKIYGARGRFARIDHPGSSSSILRVLIETKGMNWDSMYDDVSMHHESPGSSLGKILKQADGMAREQEMATIAGTRSYPEMKAWFDVYGYMNIISCDTNEYREGKLGAFTSGSILYATPDFLISAARKIAEKRKVFDINLFRSSDRRTVLVKIAHMLKERGLIVGDIPDGYFGRNYEITFFRKDFPNRSAYLMPLKIESFGLPSEFEKKKKGYLRLIERVSTVYKNKSNQET
ncbi:MAG: hypothetical protein NTX75_04010 [Proteobacteria bacterium]|nr:hypothetical protein [Pseudomonadota bacterium]